MSCRLSRIHLFDDVSNYHVIGVVTALVILSQLFRPSKLHGVPTVGSSGWLGSWWASLVFLTNAPDIIQEGYRKHKSAPFKVAELYHWIILFSSREHVDELRRAPEDTLSFMEAVNSRLRVKHTMGPELHHNPYHVPILHSKLTRNLGILYPEMRDEIITAFDDVLDLGENDEWKSIPVLSSMQRIVCRTSNRLFVGLPLCRDSNWIDLNIRYTLDIIGGAAIIGLFPSALKSIVAQFCTPGIQRGKIRGRSLLGPIIEERRRYITDYGNDWSEKPNNFLSWLMDEAKGAELTTKCLTNRLLAINFAAIHTTSQSFTHALFYLAANPQYIQPLREEVETIVEIYGWSKASLGEMRKVDSFLKECQRVEGISCLSLTRLAVKDYTFSDGTFVPKGTLVAAAARSIHRDDAFYKNADAFEPFRFAGLHDEESEGGKHQFASTTTEYLPFGHGPHACPGRFFAAIELKSMLAHLVVSYDIKFPDNALHPKPRRIFTATLPDPTAKVMFRKRAE